MEFWTAYQDWTVGERNSFLKSARQLLKTTYVVKSYDEDQRKMYSYIKRNAAALSEYFEIIGFDVVVDENVGVAMLKNRFPDDSGLQANRKKFRIIESKLLCCIWLLYMERMASDELSRGVFVDKAELDFQLEKYGLKKDFDKKPLAATLKTFEEFNLIKVIGEVGEPDCKIRLYPSLQFCLAETEFKNFVEMNTKKLFEHGAQETEEDEYEDQ